MKRFILLASVVIAALFTISSDKVFKKGNKVDIIKFDFFVENIDPSYFEGFNSATLFYNFFVYYDDSKYKINKIRTFEIEDQTGKSWELNLKKYLVAEQKYIGGHGRWYDESLSANGSLLSAGEMVCRITYRNNQISEDDFVVALPGSKEGPEDAFIYSEDYQGVIHDNYVMCLKRAKIKDAVFTGKKIIIDFIIDDEKAFNGRIWFFNRERDYLGKSEDFIRPFSLETAKFLNEGDDFYRDTRENRIELYSDEISLKSQYTVEDIYYIHIVIEDGWQFQEDSKKDNFHYRSVSKRYVVEYVNSSSAIDSL